MDFVNKKKLKTRGLLQDNGRGSCWK